MKKMNKNYKFTTFIQKKLLLVEKSKILQMITIKATVKLE